MTEVFQNLTIWISFTAFFYGQSARRVRDMKTPQQLSRQAMDEFKAIYQDEFGQTLSDDEAREIALRLLRFFGILSKPNAEEIKE
jgi:hypothetical protein